MKKLAQGLDYPRHVLPGDRIELLFDEEVVLSAEITEPHTFNDAVIFELEKGDLEGINFKYGLGGAFLEVEPDPRSPEAQDISPKAVKSLRAKGLLP